MLKSSKKSTKMNLAQLFSELQIQSFDEKLNGDAIYSNTNAIVLMIGAMSAKHKDSPFSMRFAKEISATQANKLKALLENLHEDALREFIANLLRKDQRTETISYVRI